MSKIITKFIADLAVTTAKLADDAVADKALATVGGVDLKTVGQTTLYTVPSGKTLVIVEVIARLTAASGVTVAPVIRIGKAAAYNEWLGLTTLTGLDVAEEFIKLAESASALVYKTFAAGEVVKVDVQTGATATTMTATFYVFGYLV